jgi:hypothetical protein
MPALLNTGGIYMYHTGILAYQSTEGTDSFLVPQTASNIV